MLLRSPHCGFWDQAAILDLAQSDPNVAASNLFAAEGFLAGELYSKQCYNATSLKDCNTFSVPTIDWKTNFTAACPFDASMCLVPGMRMDTGLLNTNDILGINFEPANQLTFRKVTTCAPIRQDGFVEFQKSNITNDTFALFNYGPTVGVAERPYTWPINLDVFDSTRAYTIA